MTQPDSDTARREALIAIIAEHTGLSDRTANLSEAADAILAKESQALGEALARVIELEAVIDRIHHGYRVNHSSKWVHGVTSALLTTGARP